MQLTKLWSRPQRNGHTPRQERQPIVPAPAPAATAAEHDLPVPPSEMNFVGTSDFVATGIEFMRYFLVLGRLKPHHRVLDVGCGIGRMAAPLTKFLGPTGSYDGFDIVPMGIEWCQQNITPRYPNFKFQLANIHNQTYNPQGTVKDYEYKFPYPDNTFDFIFLTSVFTHMLPQGLENYLAEIARVLKPGGRSLLTYFLLDKSSTGKIDKARLQMEDFKKVNDIYWAGNPDVPEAQIGYQESYIRDLYAKYRLDWEFPPIYGNWSGREDGLSVQDFIVGRKPLK